MLFSNDAVFSFSHQSNNNMNLVMCVRVCLCGHSCINTKCHRHQYNRISFRIYTHWCTSDEPKRYKKYYRNKKDTMPFLFELFFGDVTSFNRFSCIKCSTSLETIYSGYWWTSDYELLIQAHFISNIISNFFFPIFFMLLSKWVFEWNQSMDEMAISHL